LQDDELELAFVFWGDGNGTNLQASHKVGNEDMLAKWSISLLFLEPTNH
jgi:hypothetical protein